MLMSESKEIVSKFSSAEAIYKDRENGREKNILSEKNFYAVWGLCCSADIFMG